jgi:two-component system sensor histidine kinase TctE
MISGGHGLGASATLRRQPSLRRRLLAFLLIPTLVLMLLDTAFVYFVALRYANQIHDRDLAISTVGLAQALQLGRSDGRLTPEARRLLEYNPNGRSFFSVRSVRHGVVSGSGAHIAQSHAPSPGAAPVLYDTAVGTLPVRAASVTIASPVDPDDRLIVSMAESLYDRQHQASEILLITIPIESLLIVILLGLVWQGVKFGLRILDVPIRRLAMRERNLEPISGPDIPIEILPMTRTIDGLFERVRSLVAIQERFVADAAHQLRTPLAGLAMHVERATTARNADDMQAALVQIQALTTRVTRSATQLLALARAQAPQEGGAALSPLNLSQWLPAVVALRIPESLQAGVDLGYESPGQATTLDEVVDEDAVLMINAEPNALQELLDNLIDNALNNVSRGGTITVSLQPGANPGEAARLAIEDDGPGVPDDTLGRLGERFFRAPGAPDGGSGLGLAIVRRIADVHGAQVRFGRAGLGGLRVELRFPHRQVVLA